MPFIFAIWIFIIWCVIRWRTEKRKKEEDVMWRKASEGLKKAQKEKEELLNSYTIDE